MTKDITWEELAYKKVKKSVKVKFPSYFIDRYGYIIGSEDGKSMVQIGLNGTQVNKADTHSIETHNYFSGERYCEKKKDISIGEYREALNKVSQYIQNLINKTS